jgi:hypothetical protein
METRLHGISTCHGRNKRKVKPEFSTLHRPVDTATTRGNLRGEPSRRENTFSVMHRRRGGDTWKRGINRRGVTPGANRYPSIAAVFRRRALFFEKLLAPIRALSNFSGRFRFVAWVHDRTRIPTSLEPQKQTIETTMPTGLADSLGQF